MNQIDAMFTCGLIGIFGAAVLLFCAISAMSKRLILAAAWWLAFWFSPALIGLWLKAVSP